MKNVNGIFYQLKQKQFFDDSVSAAGRVTVILLVLSLALLPVESLVILLIISLVGLGI